MNASRIEVTIEHLVLEDLPADSHAKFVSLFTGHLERTLAQPAIASEAQAARTPVIASTLQSSGTLSALAMQVAQAVSSKVPR